MVNTFIPYSNFKKCAKALDNKRLGKQRVEAKQIINILTNATQTKGWRNHPVVLMWVGYEKALMYYFNVMVTEWIARGYKNNMPLYQIEGKIKIPWFVSNKSVNYSHRGNLIRKNAEYYGKIFTDVPKSYTLHTYIWPSKLTDEQIKLLKANKNKLVNIKQVSTISNYL
jgi:hypothetical protein